MIQEKVGGGFEYYIYYMTSPGSLSPSAKLSNFSIWAYKRNNTVFLSMIINFENEALPDGEVLFTLPSELRPKMELWMGGYGNNRTFYNFQFSSNGVFKPYGGSQGATDANVAMTAFYFTN